MTHDFQGKRVFFPQYKKGRAGLPLFDGAILDHARKLGIDVASECGGNGICRRCVVRIARGAEALSPPTRIEQEANLGPSERLACQARIVRPADVYVFTRGSRKYTVLSDGVRQEVEIAPFVRVEDGQVIWHGPDGNRSLGDHTGRTYGLAVDIGTTTLVTQVLDLASGEEIVTLASRNPQAAYGDDVISRIGYTIEHDGGLAELQAIVVQAINADIRSAVAEYALAPDEIYEAVVVGNPTMRNIFFGVGVSSLGVIPFEPPSTDPLNVAAEDLGLEINSRANVYGPPLIGGHAGADCLADIIACGLYEAEMPSMLIDIGTNGEVALGNRDRIVTASCAAGGAYEGATVRGGVGAIEGAIKNIHIRDGKAEFATIGDKPPVGICGSGLIDLLAELLRSGIMTRNARLPGDFHVTDGIVLSQQDVYQLITAKGGLRTDQDLLMRYYGVGPDDIEKLYLAGGFGNYIDADSAVTIGLLPDVKDKIVKIGNAALEGARQMLLSHTKREDAERVARETEHTKPNELEEDFPFLVAEKMYF